MKPCYAQSVRISNLLIFARDQAFFRIIRVSTVAIGISQGEGSTPVKFNLYNYLLHRVLLVYKIESFLLFLP